MLLAIYRENVHIHISRRDRLACQIIRCDWREKGNVHSYSIVDRHSKDGLGRGVFKSRLSHNAGGSVRISKPGVALSIHSYDTLGDLRTRFPYVD